MVSGKWKPRILYELYGGTRRFGELQRRIPELSRHVLTMQLRELVSDGIVRRTSYPSVPPKVEYSLTEFGRSLEALLEPFAAIGEQNIRLQKNTNDNKGNEHAGRADS